jgi:hypothetical protein
MARKPKEAEENNDLFAIEADELDEVLAGLPSDDAVINLYRLNPIGRAAYIAEFTPGEFSLEAVRNTYGGGKYKYVAKANGTVRRGNFEVDGEPLKDGKPIVRNVYKRYINGKLVYSKPEDADILVSSPTQEKPDNVPLTLLLDELRRLREEIKQPQQSPEAIKKGFIEEMVLFKELFGSQQRSPNDEFAKNAIDLIKQGMEVANMAENGGSPWMMVLDKVLPTIQEALKTFGQQQAHMIQRGVQRPDATGTATLPGSAPALSVSEMPLTGFESIADKLRAYLPTFLSAASANTDPGILVDLTYPQIPVTDRSTVQEWLESEKWFLDLCTLHPIIQGQRAWWEDYRASLLDALKNVEGENQGHDTVE